MNVKLLVYQFSVSQSHTKNIIFHKNYCKQICLNQISKWSTNHLDDLGVLAEGIGDGIGEGL